MDSYNRLEESKDPTTFLDSRLRDSAVDYSGEALNLERGLKMSRSLAYPIAARHYGLSNPHKQSTLHNGNIQDRHNIFPYHPMDQNTRPDTPSLTTGSSRSSVINCEHCKNSNQSCGCQSDPESVRDRYSELGSAQSSKTPSASIAKHEKDARGFQKVPCGGRHLHSRFEIHSSQVMKSPLSATTGNEQSTNHGEQIGSANDCCSTLPSLFPYGRIMLIPKNISLPGASDCAVESSNSDSEMDEGEDDSIEEGEYDSGDDNDWSGQNNNLEGLVLGALQGDRQFAAQLIPILHKYFYPEPAKGVTQKVSPWRYDVIKGSPGTGPSSEQTSASSGHNRESTSSRKRQRPLMIQSNEPTGSQDDENDHSEGDGNRRPKGANEPLQIDGVLELLRLACPFNKWKPNKYGIQHEVVDSSQKTDYYRSCAGPGFKSIQRLKEHLKRKHYPVQCDRCYVIFHGPDRASCVLALQNHRQHETSCKRQPDSLQEGISDAQWVSLDKKSSVKKNQQASRVEKWMEIWMILFPGVEKPDTPWYDDRNGNRNLPAPSHEVQRFADLFKPMLDLQVSQRHICFLEGSEELMKARVENLAQKAIALFFGTSDLPSSADSSSARSRHQTSLLSGSYAHVSTQPTSRGHHSTSESRSTIARSQGFSVDMSSTPTGVPMHRRTASSPGAYLDIQPMVSGDYSQHRVTSPLPSQGPGNSSYSERLPGNVDSFVASNFGRQDLGSSGDDIFGIDIHGTAFNYGPTGNMQEEGYQLDGSLLGTVENSAESWEDSQRWH